MQYEINGLFINAKKRTVNPVKISSLGDMQRCVNGYIELVGGHSTVNTLYVDEEGLFKNYTYGFAFNGTQPLMGNGLLLGPTNNKGESTNCFLSPEAAEKMIEWFIAE